MLNPNKTVSNDIQQQLAQIDYKNLFFAIYVCAYSVFMYKHYKLSRVYQDYKPKKILQ